MDILFNISIGDQSGIKLKLDKIVLEISKKNPISNDHIKLGIKTDNKYCKEVKKILATKILTNKFINE